MELEEIIKKWTGFETKGESEFDTIKEASLTFDGDTDEIKLSEKEIENLKTCLKLEKNLPNLHVITGHILSVFKKTETDSIFL